ncbi:MAG: hypothetical protein ACOX0F_08970 [Syntrophomonadaceae bacterium]|jgi:hypothetical protein
MKINTDINILGGLSDFTLIDLLLKQNSTSRYETKQQSTEIKTVKSFNRYVNVIKKTLIKFSNKEMNNLFQQVYIHEGLSSHCLLLLFWNASVNTVAGLSENVFFPALYSGRVSLKKTKW